MKNLILILALSLTLASPAIAQCVVQLQGQSVCSGYNAAPSLATATLPSGATWAPFILYNNDQNLANYSITGGSGPTPGTLVYNGGAPTQVSMSFVTVSGTAGQFTWVENTLPSGSKEIIAAFNGYTQASTTITWPVPFTTTPSIIGNTLTGVSGVTLTKTGITFAANTVNGTVCLKGI